VLTVDSLVLIGGSVVPITDRAVPTGGRIVLIPGSVVLISASALTSGDGVLPVAASS
jgi:hypothetical protein